jgi:anti-anti-sigma factor
LSIEGASLQRKWLGMVEVSRFSLVFSRALGKVVVHVHGLLDVATAPALQARLGDVIDGQGNRQVVLDLRQMAGIDVAGLFVLTDALKRMKDYGGELLFSGPTASVEEQLRAVGLEKSFGITPERFEGDAVARSAHARHVAAAGRE